MNNIPKTMSAVILKANGDYDQLEYVNDFETPIPKENEVLIEVKAAGVNNTDINTRIAWYSKKDNDSNDASGAIAGPIVELDIRTLYLKDLSFFGCTVLEEEVFTNLVKRIENKDIKPLVSKVFTLENIVEAQKEFLTKKHIGKMVLEVK